MSVPDLLFGLFEHLVAAPDGWHDVDTGLRLFLLFSATTMMGGHVVKRSLQMVGASRLQRYLRRWRRFFMRTVGHVRPLHVLQRWLPVHTRPPYQITLERWTWRDVGCVCLIHSSLLLIDVAILWVGLPWLARQVSLPIWVGLSIAVVLWATGPTRRPMSGRLAAGGIIALVWLAASPEFAVGGLGVMFVVGAICLVCIKATSDLVRGLRRWRRSNWT